jgi:hypothetical protein
MNDTIRYNSEQRLLGQLAVYEEQLIFWEEQLIFWRDRVDETVDALALIRTSSYVSPVDDDPEPGPLTVVEWGPDQVARRRAKYKIHPKAWLALQEAGPRGVSVRYLADLTSEKYKTVGPWFSQIAKLGFTIKVEKRGVPTRYFLRPENEWPIQPTDDLFMYRQYPLDLPESS